MAVALARPAVPGASALTNVIAQAQASSAAQGAQLLQAANNISRSIQLGSDQVADAMVRRRLENFQREQFDHKRQIQDRQMIISEAANRRAESAEGRAEERFPLELEGLRLGNAGTSLSNVGRRLRNEAAATSNSFLRRSLEQQQAQQDIAITRGQLGVASDVAEFGLELPRREAELDRFTSNLNTQEIGEDVITKLREALSNPATSSSSMLEAAMMIESNYDDMVRYAPNVISQFNQMAGQTNGAVSQIPILQTSAQNQGVPEGADSAMFQQRDPVTGQVTGQVTYRRDTHTPTVSKEEVKMSDDIMKDELSGLEERYDHAMGRSNWAEARELQNQINALQQRRKENISRLGQPGNLPVNSSFSFGGVQDINEYIARDAGAPIPQPTLGPSDPQNDLFSKQVLGDIPYFPTQ